MGPFFPLTNYMGFLPISDHPTNGSATGASSERFVKASTTSAFSPPAFPTFLKYFKEMNGQENYSSES